MINNATKEYYYSSMISLAILIFVFQIPEFNNLYLDMNSIIHRCSHPEDSDIHFRVGKKVFSDEEIFQNVSRYVELIFCIVKPVDLMFLAFDGVAPRAKMNQQRSHRFRVSTEVSKSNEEGIPDDDLVFDANCVTPGTEFMCELIDHMKHFIAYKISVDPLWQKCQIILSGSEVPGEGEHKIMEYIRFKKTQADYNHNTRHCLYSLDADLIMLGLCTHEPYFSILRENVTFGKRKNMLTPEESDFHLLHLSLVRDYLDCEFSPLKSKLKSKYNLEKIIDDWVLIGFLVGNDFIPQLPDFLIVNGALPLIYQTYIQVLPLLEGYLHENGDLNLSRFEKFLSHLPALGPKIPAAKPTAAGSSTEIDPVKLDLQKLDLGPKDDAGCLQNTPSPSQPRDTGINQEAQSDDQSKTRLEYYKTKLKFNDVDGSRVPNLVQDYVTAVQWTLSYYYHGCCSWSWYYPHHYAPLLLDVRDIGNLKFDFRLSEPFLPLQHLLAVLPAQNSHLLPKCLRSLVTSPKSPIIDLYPKTFEVDLNGKSNDWEAIVLIPFIEEERLLKAMEPYMKQLNFKERKRNINGPTCIFKYSDQSLGQYPVDTMFDSFNNHAQLQFLKSEDLHVPKNKLVKGLCSNFNYDHNFEGFPTLKYIPHSFGLELTKSKFQSIHPSNVEAMILSLTPKPIPKLGEIAELLLGQSVFVNWPHFREAHVIGVTDMKTDIYLDNFWKKYHKDNVKTSELNEDLSASVRENTDIITKEYEKNLGIKIHKTDILVYVFPLMGKRYVIGHAGKMQLLSRWSSATEMIPYQLVYRPMRARASANHPEKNISDIFTTSSTCFMVDQPNYGSVGKIKKINAREQRLNVTLSVAPEPDLTSFENTFADKVTYVGCTNIAKALKIPPKLISRITGSFIVTETSGEDGTKYHDIGLHLKIPKNNKELLGYTKKKNDVWSYSGKVQQLLQDYKEKFPDLFKSLQTDLSSVSIILQDQSPERLNELNQVKSWLKEQEDSYNTVFLECGTKTLGPKRIPELEKMISDFLLTKKEPQVIEVSAPANSVFKPGLTIGLVPPDVKAQHRLLDRIICVKENFTVPIGFTGTIIGIQEKVDKWKNVYEVLFDSSFAGGLSLYGSSENRCYRLMVSDFINISFGRRNKSSPENKQMPRVISNESSIRPPANPVSAASTSGGGPMKNAPMKKFDNERSSANNNSSKKGKTLPSNNGRFSKVSNKDRPRTPRNIGDTTHDNARSAPQKTSQNDKGAFNNNGPKGNPKNRQQREGQIKKPLGDTRAIHLDPVNPSGECAKEPTTDSGKSTKTFHRAKNPGKFKNKFHTNDASPGTSVSDRRSSQPCKNNAYSETSTAESKSRASNSDASGASATDLRKRMSELATCSLLPSARVELSDTDLKPSRETKKKSADSVKNSCRHQ